MTKHSATEGIPRDVLKAAGRVRPLEAAQKAALRGKVLSVAGLPASVAPPAPHPLLAWAGGALAATAFVAALVLARPAVTEPTVLRLPPFPSSEPPLKPPPESVAVPPTVLVPAPPSPRRTPIPTPAVRPALPQPAPTDAARPAPTATALHEDTLASEVELLRRARGSARTDGNAALQPLDEFERRFPASSLRDEARFIRIEALFSAGRDAEARRYAAAWQREAPSGDYAGRLARLLARHPVD